MSYRSKAFSAFSTFSALALLPAASAAQSRAPAVALGRAVIAAFEPASEPAVPPVSAAPTAPPAAPAAATGAAATPRSALADAPTPSASDVTRDSGAPLALPNASDPAPKTFVALLKLGSVVGGSGSYSTECKSYGGAVCPSYEDTDYDEKSVAGLGADFLWHLGPKVRMGFGGLFTTPQHDVEGQEFAFGPEIGLFGILEGFFPTSDHFALTVRGQVGGSLLFAGEDHRDAIDEVSRSCADLDKCENSFGPFPGLNLAVGVGVNFRVGESTRLRVDAMTEGYAREIMVTDVASAGAGVKLSTQASGTRGWLMAGVEL
ncbi:MAG: hypothetical protein R3B13_08155 [Polyangiaceae bacterium]